MESWPIVGSTGITPIEPTDFSQASPLRGRDMVLKGVNFCTSDPAVYERWEAGILTPKSWKPLDKDQFGNKGMGIGRHQEGICANHKDRVSNCIRRTAKSEDLLIYQVRLRHLNFFLLVPSKTYDVASEISSMDGGKWYVRSNAHTSPQPASLTRKGSALSGLRRLTLVFRTHPSCLALDSVLWGKMFESLSKACARVPTTRTTERAAGKPRESPYHQATGITHRIPLCLSERLALARCRCGNRWMRVRAGLLSRR